MSLTVDHLSVRYALGGKRFVHAVRDVSLTLRQGETLGLVGESGCGKSSLARALVGLESMADGMAYFEDLRLGTQNKPALLRQWRRAVQMVFQDPYSSLNPRLRIGEMLDEVLKVNTGLPASGRADRINDLLELVGLPSEAVFRYPHQFSGGQRQRIGIARALSVGAKILILDEPVSALDVSVQAQVVNLLQDIQKRDQLGYLFVSHDLAVVEHLCTTISVMYLGQIVESGPAKAVCRSPLHPYTKALISAVPTPLGGLGNNYIPLNGEPPSPLHPPSGCAFHPRCPHVGVACYTLEYRLIESCPGHFTACPYSASSQA